MMKINYSTIFRAFTVMVSALIFTALMSCIDENSNWAEDKQLLSLDEDQFVKGLIHVKFEPETGQAIEANLAEEGTRAFAGFPQLEGLAENIKIKEIKRIFPHAGKFEPRSRARGLHLWYNIYFEQETGLTRAVQDFGKIEGVEIVEPSPIIKRIDNGEIVPLNAQQADRIVAAGNGTRGAWSQTAEQYQFNDPLLGDQWNYINNGSFPQSISGADINVKDVWPTQSGHSDVIVAVIDEGVQYDHPDLADNCWVNDAELNGADNVDDDNNGYVDDIYGWNFVSNNNRINPDDHGTHVAGTIAAVNNNGIGVSGIAGGNGTNGSGVRVMSCEIFSPNGADIFTHNLAAAIKYGADNGAVISQNSWGGFARGGYPKAIADAFLYFIEFAGFDENGVQTGPMAGGVVICGSGNDNMSDPYFFPAAYDFTIAVSAIDYAYKKASYSNYGGWINISAPGGDTRYGTNKGLILSTINRGQYGYMAGTSMACPHVSGVAALMIAEYGVGKKGFTPNELTEILLRTANDLNPYNSNYHGMLGTGTVDAFKCINYYKLPPEPVTDLGYSWVDNTTIELRWLLTSDPNDYAASEYLVFVDTESFSASDIPTMNPTVSVTVPSAMKVGDEITCRVGNLSKDQIFYIAIVGLDNMGNRSIPFFKRLNGPPMLNREFADIYFGEMGKSASIDLNEYFIDSDTPELNFSAIVTPEGVVSTVIEGSILTITSTGWGIAEVTVTASDEGNSISATFAVAARDDINKDMELYPNPVSDKFYIKMDGNVNGGAEVKLYNSTGILAYSGSVSITPYAPGVVPVDSLASGTYTVVVNYKNTEHTGTIVKI